MIILNLDVMDFDITPGLGEGLGNETAVAVIGGGLAAQQAADFFIEDGAVKGLRNFTLGEQSQESISKFWPVFVGMVGLEDGFGGRKLVEVEIIAIVQRAQKVAQVFALGETGQLAVGMQANIDDAFDAVSTQQIKKLPGCFLGKADGVEFHGGEPYQILGSSR